MKQGLNSSTTRTYPNQLVVARTSIALRLPKYAWIGMVLLAMALLATAAIFRERDGLRAAQASYNRTQQTLQMTQQQTEVLLQSLQNLQQNKTVVAQEAQKKLNYVRPNEVVVVVR
ncbi:MAG: septum formation initiator family protein [Blastocatellia bacterium]